MIRLLRQYSLIFNQPTTHHLRYSDVKLSMNSFADTAITEIENSLIKIVSLTYFDKLAPICAPITDPNERNMAGRYSG